MDIDRGLHQHALLNLARLHYCVGELLGGRRVRRQHISFVCRSPNIHRTGIGGSHQSFTGSKRSRYIAEVHGVGFIYPPSQQSNHLNTGANRLLRRIAPSAESPQVIQKGTDPIDVLWDIKRSMDMVSSFL